MKQTQRKKQPEQVRAQLIVATGAIIADRGLGAVSLEQAARDAGVSKGGLLHHFPSRSALIDALFDSMFTQWDLEIGEYMAADPVPEGRFTRAYIRSVMSGPAGRVDNRLICAFIMAMHTDEALRQRWNQWLAAYTRPETGAENSNENTLERRLARAAADGLWLADYADGIPPDDALRAAMVERLIASTL